MADVDDAATQLGMLLGDFVAYELDEDPIPDIRDCMERLADYRQQTILQIIKAAAEHLEDTVVFKLVRFNMNITLGILLRGLGPQQRYELLNVRDFHGNTPIHEAVTNVEDRTLMDMLGLLHTINEKIQLLRMQNRNENTAIHYAVSAGNEPSMRIMLNGVGQRRIHELLKIRNAKGETAVFGGIRKGNMEIVRYMLERVAAVDRVNLLKMENVQGTALHYAAWAGHVMPYWLIDFNSNYQIFMEEENKRCRTPIHCAMSQGHANVVEAMLTVLRNYGYPFDSVMRDLLQNKDDNGNTPLHSAAAAGHMNAIGTALHFLTPDSQQRVLGMQNRRNETVVQVAIATRDRLHGTIELLNKYNGSTDDTTSVQGWCSI